MPWRFGAEIETMRLEVVAAPVLQVGLAAVVVSPPSAVPAVSALPLVWPVLAAALIWGAWSLARRLASFERVYRLALPLAMIAFLCDFALFSTIFEGGFFGLFGGPRGF